MQKTSSETIKTSCWFCDGETNHKVLFTKTIKNVGKTTNDFHVVQCQGCDGVTFLHVEKKLTRSKKNLSVIHYNYPDPFDDNHEDYDFLSFDDIPHLPKRLAKLYNEVEEAFCTDSAILSGLGLRTLVEAVCLDQRIPGRNLQKKIRGLHEKGLISTSELPILDKLRVIGNASAHEIQIIPMNRLKYALDIINHVLKSIYVLPQINKRLLKYVDTQK